MELTNRFAVVKTTVVVLIRVRDFVRVSAVCVHASLCVSVCPCVRVCVYVRVCWYERFCTYVRVCYEKMTAFSLSQCLGTVSLRGSSVYLIFILLIVYLRNRGSERLVIQKTAYVYVFAVC